MRITILIALLALSFSAEAGGPTIRNHLQVRGRPSATLPGGITLRPRADAVPAVKLPPPPTSGPTIRNH